ncbi:MAG: Trk system potassium transporter TrkA [Geminicoccaceae bacterium]|jgi:trk system potassium uptake protein TrkA|nr:Trk system potassium transporter TrkA [Geminicoccaceae bacterium]MCB9969055.1 Trk system potassium transporter TrkA [Geminicoccaceae bacterium]HRY24642.1 Trk system potassium transporter TrkA [Geminicoccaceae bacterium]
MKVIVAGAGLVGFNIARYLAAAGNDVVIIDQRPELVRKIGDSLDIQAMVGHASHPSTLEHAGAADADMFIAVTQVDEVNMVACQVAHTLFNVPTKIARVRQQDYLQSRWQDLFRRDHLPIDVVISPEVEVAHAIALRLEVPGALNVVPFAEDRVRLIALRCTEATPIINTPLRQLTYLFPDLHLVCVGVARGDQFFIPHADDQLLPDDEVHFVVETAHLERALPAFGYEERMSDRIIIVGGGNIGLFLARELEGRYPHLSIKVIENNPERAERIADELKRSVVLCGDARDRTLLDEANVRSAQAIVTVTNDDEVNIMAALLGKRLGCERALALVNNSTYNLVVRLIGLDVAINPRETTVSSILQHVRRGRLKSVHTIRDGEAEIYEAEALETSPLVGKPLKDFRQSGGMIVGAIIRDDKVIMPRGDTVVQAHDRVVMVARSDVVRKVEQLFAVRLDYF